MWWHHPVVVEVVEVVALLLSHGDLLQELHHAATNEAWDDHAHWEAMVRGQPAVVLWWVRGEHITTCSTWSVGALVKLGLPANVTSIMGKLVCELLS